LALKAEDFAHELVVAKDHQTFDRRLIVRGGDLTPTVVHEQPSQDR
jgi:hypothetical protein